MSQWRADFPIFQHQPDLVYLDSASSAQKPNVVLQTMHEFLAHGYANVHRGLYSLSQNATTQFEAARQQVAKFMGAQPNEIVFTRSATEALNLVAQCYGRSNLQPGDEILLTQLEHHANIVPWQMLAVQTGAIIKVVPLAPYGSIALSDFTAYLTPRTKIAAFAHMSNLLGCVLPVAGMVKAAQAVGAVAVVDGCQAMPHLAVNVAQLGADFYVWSGHKLYGPTGVGVLFGRYELLCQMPPYQGGGDMIEHVGFGEGETTYKLPPSRFEAGTPAIAEVIGLGAAVAYWQSLNHAAVQAHENELYNMLQTGLSKLPGVQQFTPRQGPRAAIVPFVVEGCHAADVATLLAQQDVCLRAGHHCAMPLVADLGQTAILRASIGLYNTQADIEKFLAALQKTIAMLR